MTAEFKEDELLQQQEAVKLYLSALFKEETTAEPVSEKVVEVKNISHAVDKKQTRDQTNAILNDRLPKIDHQALQSTIQSNIPVPSWATKRFACSLIAVGGLNLFIPTQFIRGVRRISEPLYPITKNPSWIKGRYQKNFETLLVVNTKNLIYGREEFIPPKRRVDNDVYIVVVGNGQWGFSCESIGHGINLTSNSIEWRNKQGNRRWLAGTNAEHKAAVVDVRRVELSLIMDGLLV